ncbi:metallophosphoesterase family protein [Paraburkholderia sp. BCC1885]|uniref:metallophosphoesterase family protein n=1 Tax=Paraburkholderia sp. BCC1885 TaxID=2562669 RepID=UPI0016423CED|nr:metallophosphoesterase [Paraburkholderia sp. BCC1885]
MISLLHISDLHRDTGSRITTESLLESLRLDRDRYLHEGLPTPDVAIVSGDIVYGVNTSDADSDAALKRQYDEAHDFLVRLADTFFAGDRERIVLVPGNHDVSHPHVMRATEAVGVPAEPDKRRMLARELGSETSAWRWVWDEFALRRIVSPDEYNRRMEPFASFFTAFYEGRREFSVDPAAQFSLHDFPDLGIVVAGLSSCADNDLFNRSARIHPDNVARVTREVAAYVKKGRLPIAVWHHNLAGGPKDSDYLDAEFLQTLMDGHFSIGLHGHQHRPQYLEHRFTADKKRTLTVLSAGTLCGGPQSLPTGRRRSYNLIIIDRENSSGTLHVREMTNNSFSLPVWGAAYVPEFEGSSMKFEMTMAVQPISPIQAAGEAVKLLRTGDAPAAAKLARKYPDEPYARRVALEAMTTIDDWAGIREFCAVPQSNLEIIAVCEALYQLGEKQALRDFIAQDVVADNPDAAVRISVETAKARAGVN